MGASAPFIMQATSTEGRDEKGHFLPGYTANPAGKPRDTFSLVAMIKKKLKQVPEGSQRSFAEHIIDKTVEDAIKGNVVAMKLLWNYVEGMPKQHTDITSGGKPIPILGGNVPDNNSDDEDTGSDEEN